MCMLKPCFFIFWRVADRGKPHWRGLPRQGAHLAQQRQGEKVGGVNMCIMHVFTYFGNGTGQERQKVHVARRRLGGCDLRS